MQPAKQSEKNNRGEKPLCCEEGAATRGKTRSGIAVFIGCTHAVKAELCSCATGQVCPCTLVDALSGPVSGSLLVPWINFVCPLETGMSR